MRTPRNVFFVAALALALAAPAIASAESVLLTVAVDVASGKLDQYVATVGKGRGIIERLGTQGSMRIWQGAIAGQDTGRVVVGIEYPSLAAYADATTKMQADAEWGNLIGGLDSIRTITGSNLNRELDVGGKAGGGSTIQVVVVKVNPGKLDAYLAEVKKLRGIQDRLGVKGGIRAWHAAVAGTNTGNVFVVLDHASLADYAEATATVQADAEYASTLAGLDSMRTLLSSSLYQEITP